MTKASTKKPNGVRARGARTSAKAVAETVAKKATRTATRKSVKKRARRAKCFVYLLGANDKDGLRTYVGWTLDVERRLAQHNGGKGGARSTRGRVWKLLHLEHFATRNAAMSREWHLKRDRPFRKLLAQKLLSDI